MPRETKIALVTRAAEIVSRLLRAYPDANCELNHTNPLELLIATILSAQCTDKRVNLVTADLFKRYRSAAEFANESAAVLEEQIKSTGFFRNKAKAIKKCCAALVEKHGGRVPQSLEELTALGGVGRKTANVVLGNAFNINSGIVLDTHVGRLSQRLALSKNADPEKIERELMPLIPQNQWAFFSHLLIWHGRRRCYARNPDCPNCEVLTLCPRVGVRKSPRARGV